MVIALRQMIDFRCKKCRKLLFKYNNDVRCEVEIKCDRCGTINKTENNGKVTSQEKT